MFCLGDGVKAAESLAGILCVCIRAVNSATNPLNRGVNNESHQITPHQVVAKSSLSDPQRQLIEVMQRLNFGRIEALGVRDGEPIFDPAPRVIQTLKIGGENGPRPEYACPDFILQKPTIELLEAISSLRNGTILAINVKHGLPFTAEFEVATAKPSGGQQ